MGTAEVCSAGADFKPEGGGSPTNRPDDSCSGRRNCPADLDLSSACGGGKLGGGATGGTGRTTSARISCSTSSATDPLELRLPTEGEVAESIPQLWRGVEVLEEVERREWEKENGEEEDPETEVAESKARSKSSSSSELADES